MYQINPPLSPSETLPTMYDLPSENQEESGLPDEFHLLQPQLLSLTFRPPSCPVDRFFTASDLNLYYDPQHHLWYKRPDWFAVLGVNRLYQKQDLRLSYVTWQEGINPFVAVELISPGTEAEDLGSKNIRDINQLPNKWTVHEQILRIPYYFVFNRYTDELKAFILIGNHYQELTIKGQGIWLEEAQLGIGLWYGNYQGCDRLWLRCYNDQGNWILTPEEREKKRADSAELELAKLRECLKQAGLEIPQSDS